MREPQYRSPGVQLLDAAEIEGTRISIMNTRSPPAVHPRPRFDKLKPACSDLGGQLV